MTPSSDFKIRTIVNAEVELFQRQLTRAFGGDPLPKKDEFPLLKILDLDRTFAAFDGDQLVGTCAAFTFDLSIPGGVLPMGGTTMVSVQPTHRRRGILRAMMREHIEDVRSRGEPLAGLWCSESSIYQQFGYGSAAERFEMKANASKIDFAGEPSNRSLSSIEPAEARKILPNVYDRVRNKRPGMFTRSDGWWEAETFRDIESEREGHSAKRFVICRGAGDVEGYVIYRQLEKWKDFPEGEIQVVELFTATSESHEALWRLLMNIDLFPNVSFWNMPVDDELQWRVTEPRRVERRAFDSLWIRLIDIPRALCGRSYAESGRCVLGIHDPFLPENNGNYDLVADAKAAECRRTRSDADVTCGVDALGALYLGGHRATTLARAGRISGDARSIESLDRMFAWSPAPWCSGVF
jgi:predicted acetyltransferase